MRLVDQEPGHAAYNIIIEVANPVDGTDPNDPRLVAVDALLHTYGKSIETVANKIFPIYFYYRYGAPAFFTVFRNRVIV